MLAEQDSNIDCAPVHSAVNETETFICNVYTYIDLIGISLCRYSPHRLVEATLVVENKELKYGTKSVI